MRHSLRTTLFPSPFYFSFGDRDREKRRKERGRAPMAGGGVGWLVGWLVGWSVGRSVGRSVGPLVSDRGSSRSCVRHRRLHFRVQRDPSERWGSSATAVVDARFVIVCLRSWSSPRFHAVTPAAFRKRTNGNSDCRSFLFSFSLSLSLFLYFSLENAARQKSPRFVSRRSVATATRNSRQYSKKYQIYGRENIRVRDTRNGFSSRDLRGRREGSSLMDLRRNL